MLFALSALRGSPADDLKNRTSLVDALEKTAVTSERGRLARDRCVEAYRLLVAAKVSTRAAKEALARPGETSKNVLTELSAAEEQLKKSEEVMPRCEEAASALRLGRR